MAPSSHIDKILTIVLICSIITAIGIVAYVIATPKKGEKFTEFYILGPEGKAENYPREMMVGEKAKVLLGIVNHEYRQIVYRIKVEIQEDNEELIGPITLHNKEEWEQNVSFSLTRPGKNMKVEFLLYKNNEKEPYRKLHLWIEVKEEIPVLQE